MSSVTPEIKAVVDRGFACWNSGEIDLMADDYADDAELDTTMAFPGGRCYKGRDEFGRFFHEQWDAWDRLSLEPLDVADAGDGRFVVEVRLTGVGRGSGIEVDQRMGFLYTLREQDGKVARCQMFPTKAEALEAVGLSE
jgi:ketosteroid isomerase-like protein